MKKVIIGTILLFAVILYAGQARWTVEGFDSNFNPVAVRTVNFNYSGQAVTMAGLKSVTASQYNLAYTGSDTVRAGETYYGVEPIEAWGKTIVWVRIDNIVRISVTE